MKSLRNALLAAAALGTGFTAAPALSAEWDGSKPAPGIYFYWYEPSFYAGFAPRSQDPKRFHIELSRGNQMRLTMVLGPEELDNYLPDLMVRQETYKKLVDGGIIKLSVNKNYERFNEALEQLKIGNFLAKRDTMDEKTFRATTAQAMAQLNPGRVFYIHIPTAKLFADWHAKLKDAGAEGLKSLAKRLDLANAVVPGRINLFEMTDEQTAALKKAVELAQAGGPDSPEFVSHAENFITNVTNGHYLVRDGHVDAIEFTQILPAGTV
ncbi:MAG: hypothetical protein ACR2OR_01665, partial [Hyphomicrobiales bacterium]